ncbi:coatomer subunit zeta-1-like isoform X5 [Scyliorhinus canicula]|uniref:coatomer subunit zeta-1-like isoform X6 n=1 Tax=Scyliorhinus canicula TaxID=7830 RepID=UPI0018F7AB40|nr:coatomer subunit zeta-1-like isoform X6 [Scyliorhinus canicula]XP_038635366.1 coatomer subunit zeta-1-like isoform X5 [Scyliorhinus canicula]
MAREPVTEAGSGSKICPRRHYHNMDPSALEPSLYTVKAIIILDNDGERLHAKYYDNAYPSTKEQRNFEKNIFSKTHKNDTHVNDCSQLPVRFFEPDATENVEKKSLMENMDGVLLIMDEIVDGGVILESDPQQVIQKVNFRVDDTPLTEQSMAQQISRRLGVTNNVLQSAKDQIKWSLLK